MSSRRIAIKKMNKPKNILIINGSPRRRGNISGMLDIMRQEAESRGWHTETVRVHDLTIQPCTGCMACRSTGKCHLPEDDAVKVLEQIRDADALIVGAPCYWGNIPGQLKQLFDRIVYGMMGETTSGLPRPLHKGKRAVIVSTCTTVFPFNILFGQSRGAVRAVREILKWSGFRVVGTLEKGGTRKHPGLAEREMGRCRKLVQRL